MNEMYKLVITKLGKFGNPVNMAMCYRMTAEHLCAAEEEFEAIKKEPGVIRLLLWRYDETGIHELRKWEAKNA